VREVVLQYREVLEDDISDRLRYYGIQIDKAPLPLERLKHLREDEIQVSPFVYRISDDLQNIFKKALKLPVVVRGGMNTGDNFRFVRSTRHYYNTHRFSQFLI
jgi:hypothetical protein